MIKSVSLDVHTLECFTKFICNTDMDVLEVFPCCCDINDKDESQECEIKVNYQIMLL